MCMCNTKNVLWTYCACLLVSVHQLDLYFSSSYIEDFHQHGFIITVFSIPLSCPIYILLISVSTLSLVCFAYLPSPALSSEHLFDVFIFYAVEVYLLSCMCNTSITFLLFQVRYDFLPTRHKISRQENGQAHRIWLWESYQQLCVPISAGRSSQSCHRVCCSGPETGEKGGGAYCEALMYSA